MGPQGAGDRPERARLHPGPVRPRALPAAAAAGHPGPAGAARRARSRMRPPSGKVSTAMRPPRSTCAARCSPRDRVLLVRERSDGRWTLPGGWVDVNDSPVQGGCARDPRGVRLPRARGEARRAGRQEPPPAPAEHSPHLQADVPVRAHRRCARGEPGDRCGGLLPGRPRCRRCPPAASLPARSSASTVTTWIRLSPPISTRPTPPCPVSPAARHPPPRPAPLRSSKPSPATTRSSARSRGGRPGALTAATRAAASATRSSASSCTTGS